MLTHLLGLYTQVHTSVLNSSSIGGQWRSFSKVLNTKWEEKAPNLDFCHWPERSQPWYLITLCLNILICKMRIRNCSWLDNCKDEETCRKNPTTFLGPGNNHGSPALSVLQESAQWGHWMSFSLSCLHHIFPQSPLIIQNIAVTHLHIFDTGKCPTYASRVFKTQCSVSPWRSWEIPSTFIKHASPGLLCHPPPTDLEWEKRQVSAEHSTHWFNWVSHIPLPRDAWIQNTLNPVTLICKTESKCRV